MNRKINIPEYEVSEFNKAFKDVIQDNFDYIRIKGEISDSITNLEKEYLEKDIFIIGGPEIIKQTFNLFKEFYLTRIYGNFNCDKFIDISLLENNMQMLKKIDGDKSCHFEIWKK